MLVLASASAGDTNMPLGRKAFADRRDPPAWRELPVPQRQHFDLGLLVFNTPWVVAGTPNAARVDGLGPLFVAASCDACHNNGARGRPPATPEGLSNSFVLQLEGPGSELYGAVLNTAAIADHAPEGRIEVQWTVQEGRYADGTAWRLKVPQYRINRWLYGAPAADTVLRPRIAPAMFGAGLLEAVSVGTLRDIQHQQPPAVRGELPAGRFGWQAEALDVEHQTALAFAREMGLTSRRLPRDDCTPAQVACRVASKDDAPEVSDEFLDAVVTYQKEIAVPVRAPLAADREADGRDLFNQTGCSSCHVPDLPVVMAGKAGSIDAGTDLLVHDLGEGLADRNLAGQPVRSRWRTAPLWGLAHAQRFGEIALLHDGRAASVEEAILWHGGQAEEARGAFLRLTAAQRGLLLEWVESL